ncbi:TIGR01440 family protein [Pontibacillus litoralis]|uniref:UPF0340 protein N784_04670 n=1 Tax=Pontibacillus litoralis JSM 072002 TaxID=1385512 RepID=A0A0A5G046_9BACI|nr:TIGR01440 family protein [Pontibacillus litoralis]KGX86451.1 hypothetical protein N784_04670 [Pontibacillus litoralis JSM 072002]
MNITSIQKEIESIVDEWITSGLLYKGQLFVIGCSTSEVAGERIGTSGSEEIAAVLFQQFRRLQDQTGVHLAFQGCEHINRALVMDRQAAEQRQLESVSVIPVNEAGGSMAAYAHQHILDPVVVEHIQAHHGMDIGDTFIGMHMKHVVVPLRFKYKQIGAAHVTCATTRPKLIGGARAVYQQCDVQSTTCDY